MENYGTLMIYTIIFIPAVNIEYGSCPARHAKHILMRIRSCTERQAQEIVNNFKVANSDLRFEACWQEHGKEVIPSAAATIQATRI